LKYLPALFLCIFSFQALAQNGLSQIGARPAAMGYAYATEHDVWTFFNNPGGLGQLNDLSAFFAFENRYGIEGLNLMGAGVVSKLPVGSFGVGAFRFGDDFYNEQTVSAAYGNKFGIASLGLKVNYLDYNIEGFGSKSIFTIDFGGIATITDQLVFGAYIRNINQAQLAELEDERAPTLLNAGLSFRPSEKFRINAEAEKDLDHDATLRVGAEYQIFSKIAVRTGINTEPFTNYAGLGFKTGILHIDYALTKDRTLGYSHQAAISVKIRDIE